MDYKSLVKEARNYEVRIRKNVQAQMQGDFHSVFKGSGLEFDDVRSYQYGDDVRHIDWNVSAKGHGTFIKTFKEEKEQNLFFLLDVSASQRIGKPDRQKIDLARRLCAVLAFAGAKEQSSVGLLCFTDQTERYVKPGKGEKQAYRIAKTVSELEPSSKKTSLAKGISTLMSIVRRKSMVILISDFVDEDFEESLSRLGYNHDLIVLHVADDREGKFPKLGVIPLLDQETGKKIWVNTSARNFRRRVDGYFAGRRAEVERICKRASANYLYVNTKDDYVSELVKLFKVRKFGR